MGKLDFPRLCSSLTTKYSTTQLSNTIETKLLPVNIICVWRASGFTDDASIALLLRESADQRIKKIALTNRGLEYTATEMILKPGELTDRVGEAVLSTDRRNGSIGHELLNISLNSSIMVTSSSSGNLSILPTHIDRGANASQQMVLAFASAIINTVAYDDLLRAYQSILRKLKGPPLDDVMTRIWKILQEHDAYVITQEIKGGWLVPYLEFIATVFRYEAGDTLLYASSRSDSLSSIDLQWMIDCIQQRFCCISLRRIAYFRGAVSTLRKSSRMKGRSECGPMIQVRVLPRTIVISSHPFEFTESAWLLLSHMEWYFQLVRTVVCRSLLPDEGQSATSISPQNAALDFLLSHPLALKLLLAICNEIRGFALFVTRNTLPSAPYPGSSQTALLLDAVSTSQLQNVLRDRVENLGIRISHWERVLHQLSQSQEGVAIGKKAICHQWYYQAYGVWS